MSPQLILSLWRERWGKPAAGGSAVPYLEGFLHSWGKNVVASGFWSLPLASALTVAVCGALFVLALTVALPQGSQIALSVFLLGWALFARRFNGAFFALLVVSLSVLVSLRYFYWRLTASLGLTLDVDFAFGMALCLAEVYLWVLTLLGYVSKLLPVTQPSLPLSDDTTVWPTVDVFIACNELPHAQVVSAVKCAQALDWPHKKCRVYLIDRLAQSGLKELAFGMGVGHIACPEHLHDLNGQINHALPQSHGKLIVIADSDGQLDSRVLLECGGWFVHDEQLAMLQTPVHFLAPNPSAESLEFCGGATAPGSFAVLRRSALVEAGGLPPKMASAHAHIALTFQELGYRHAYVGLNGSANALLLRSPFLGRSLLWKRRLLSLEAAMRFYYPLCRWAFCLAPVAYFLGRLPLIHASSIDLTAYALPHLLLMFLATERIQNPRRTPLPLLLRESLLAWYILVCTTICLIKTGSAKGLESLFAAHDQEKLPFNAVAAVPYIALFCLNAIALYMGALLVVTNGFDWHNTSAIFGLWALYWLLIFTAMLAVAQESRHIQRYRLAQVRVPVMLKLPSGRSINCMTENFPQSCLVLALPNPIAVQVGSHIRVSIFRGHRETLFMAQVISLTGAQIQIQIEETEQNEYRDLGVASRSRGEDWPKWLPGRDADQPLPRWMTQFFTALSHKILSGVDGLLHQWKLKK